MLGGHCTTLSNFSMFARSCGNIVSHLHANNLQYNEKIQSARIELYLSVISVKIFNSPRKPNHACSKSTRPDQLKFSSGNPIRGADAKRSHVKPSLAQLHTVHMLIQFRGPACRFQVAQTGMNNSLPTPTSTTVTLKQAYVDSPYKERSLCYVTTGYGEAPDSRAW